MLEEKVARELSAFGFARSHIKILQAIHPDGLTADHICSVAGIPKGRIYSLLKALVTEGLLHKLPERPARYVLGNLEDFADRQLALAIERRARLVARLQKPDAAISSFHNDPEGYTSRLLENIINESELRFITREHSIPLYFYPLEKRLFMRLRENLRRRIPTLTTLLRTGDELTWAMTKIAHRGYRVKRTWFLVQENGLRTLRDALLQEIGPEAFREYLAQLRQRLHRDRAQIRLLHTPNTASTLITPGSVCMAMAVGKEILGFVIKSRELAHIHTMLFNSIWSRGRPIEGYLKYDKMMKL